MRSGDVVLGCYRCDPKLGDLKSKSSQLTQRISTENVYNLKRRHLEASYETTRERDHLPHSPLFGKRCLECMQKVTSDAVLFKIKTSKGFVTAVFWNFCLKMTLYFPKNWPDGDLGEKRKGRQVQETNKQKTTLPPLGLAQRVSRFLYRKQSH